MTNKTISLVERSVEQSPKMSDQISDPSLEDTSNDENTRLKGIDLTSREFRCKILPIIQNSFWSDDSLYSFHITECQLVINSRLEQEYMRRKIELKNNYTLGPSTECYGFAAVDNDDVLSICKEGAVIGNSKCSLLGNPEKGVCVQKHADVLSKEPLLDNQKGRFIMYRLMLGRQHVTEEFISNLMMSPKRTYDSHVSKNLKADLSAKSVEEVFNSTQYYIFEYKGDSGPDGLLSHPRQIRPYAVITYSNKRIPPSLSTSVSNSVPHPSNARSAMAAPTTIWEGKLSNADQYIVNAQLTTQCVCLKPISFPKEWKIVSCLSLHDWRAKYMCRFPPLHPSKEVYSARTQGLGLNYAVYLQLVADMDTRHLQELTRQLVKEKKVAIADVADARAFFLPQGYAAKELELLPAFDKTRSETSLHVILMSPTSMIWDGRQATMRTTIIQCLSRVTDHDHSSLIGTC